MSQFDLGEDVANAAAEGGQSCFSDPINKKLINNTQHPPINAKFVLIIMGVLSSTDLDAFVKAMQEQQKKKDDKGEKKEETMDTDWK